MPICDTCDRHFVWKRRSSNTKTTCPSCYSNRHRFAIKAAAIEYKGGSCQLCGYSRCMRALGFHHVDPATKKFDIGHQTAFSRSRAKLIAELDKCICVCHNCHAEIEDALDWRPNDGILVRVAEIYSLSPKREFKFKRSDWAKHHPAPSKRGLFDFPEHVSY